MPQRQPTSPRPSSPQFYIVETKEEINLSFKGSWTCCKIGTLEEKFKIFLKSDISKKLPVKIQFENDCVLDTAGACLIANAIKFLKGQKRFSGIIGDSPSTLLNYFLTFQPAIQSFKPRLNWKTRWLDHIGYNSVILGKTALSMFGFLGEIFVTICLALKSTLRIRWVSVFRHSQEMGIKALPIVGLISFLIGMILSYQSINQLKYFGAELYTIDFLGISILREIAVLLTAIVIAGRSGSAFTAQIGTMALNQEIDAIRMLGLNPILILVVPRLMAILICLPLLVFFSMITGLLGGIVTINLIIDVTPTQFANHFQQAITLKTFWVGMSKAPLFAVIIGLVGTFRGFQVKGNAESVGRMTTQSVVESIFLVIICDAFMSILFSYLKM